MKTTTSIFSLKISKLFTKIFQILLTSYFNIVKSYDILYNHPEGFWLLEKYECKNIASKQKKKEYVDWTTTIQH